MTTKETEIVMPKDIIEYIDSKLIGNVVPLNTERDAIFMIENYAEQKLTQKKKDIDELVEFIKEVSPMLEGKDHHQAYKLIKKHTKK